MSARDVLQRLAALEEKQERDEDRFVSMERRLLRIEGIAWALIALQLGIKALPHFGL